MEIESQKGAKKAAKEREIAELRKNQVIMLNILFHKKIKNFNKCLINT